MTTQIFSYKDLYKDQWSPTYILTYKAHCVTQTTERYKMKLVKLISSQNFHFYQVKILTKSQFRAVFPTVSCETSSFVAFYGCFGCLQLHFIFISLGSLAGWLGGSHTPTHTYSLKTHLYAEVVAVKNLCSCCCCCCCWGCFLRRISINYARPLCDCNSCVSQPATRAARATVPT